MRTDTELPRIPGPPTGAHITVRCAQCGHFGLDEEPCCDHEDRWVFITAGMRSWMPYVRRERWALGKAKACVGVVRSAASDGAHPTQDAQ